jgi:hypothetical protein
MRLRLASSGVHMFTLNLEPSCQGPDGECRA